MGSVSLCVVLLARGLAYRGPTSLVSRARPIQTARAIAPSGARAIAPGGSSQLVVCRATSVENDAMYPRSKFNAPILLGFLIWAVSLLLFRDVIAILALYEYDSVMEASWLPESMKLLARLPKDLLCDYGAAAKADPLWVKACTSGVAYVAGDLVAQAYEGRRRVDILDLTRTARNGALGFFLHGPVLHYWIAFLEGPATLAFCSSLGLAAVAAQSPAEYGLIVSKIALDQTVFALGFNVIYAVGLGVLATRTVPEIVDNVKTTIIPSMVSSWRFWPLVHLISYSPLVPVEYKLLYIDFMEIIWVAILSFIANDEKTELGAEPTVVVVDEFDVQPAVEVLLASRLEILGNQTNLLR